MLTFLLGGVRSGKSALAVEIGRRHQNPVTFIATAEAFDEDLTERIARHRTQRPPWPTIEAPLDLAGAVAGVEDDSLVIVDCVTVWLGNLYHHHPTPSPRREVVDQNLRALIDELTGRARRRVATVVISNEVGLGIVPDSELGRAFRDDLGRINQHIAHVADHTLMLVAGRAMRCEDPFDLLTPIGPGSGV